MDLVIGAGGGSGGGLGGSTAQYPYAGNGSNGSSGGSGIIIVSIENTVRYSLNGDSVDTHGSNTILIFRSSGNFSMWI